MIQYYIIGGQGDHRQNFTKLSSDDLRVIKDSCSILYKFGYYDKREIEIQENLKDFLKVYAYAEQEVIGKTDEELRDGLFNEIFINVNRTFTNYLSSYKIQIDHERHHTR